MNKNKKKVKEVKTAAILILLLLICLIIDSTYKNLKYKKTDYVSNSTVKVRTLTPDEYEMDLDKFNIKNNGTDPLGTSKGINEGLKYAKEKGYKTVVMPEGVYCISEKNPIKMLDDLTLDLDGSTFKINANGLERYALIDFSDCKNSTLVNGTLLGDRYQHDYKTIKSTHEWDSAVVFNNCDHCSLDNLTVEQFPGYAIFSTLGKNLSDLTTGVTKDNLTVGNISDKGVQNMISGTIRTINPLDVSRVGSEFELGYNKGYMGYPYISAKTYDTYFYDKDMKFISASKMCCQYKKVSIPKGVFYVNFVFHQEKTPESGDTDFNNTTVFLTNYYSPHDIKITNSLIENNRALGMGLCGGRDFLIENNTFKNNKGGAPGYAIDLEDGWEYMQNFTFKGNKFIGNANDVVICAGDNILFENNAFTSTVYMYGRTTNYKFLNNHFQNISTGITYEYSTDTISTGNEYSNCSFSLSKLNPKAKLTLDKETFKNTSITQMNPGEEVTNSSIISDASNQIRLAGVFRNCTFNCANGDFVSARIFSSKLKQTNLNCQGDTAFDNCEFNDSVNNTTSNTKSISADNCSFEDSGFLVNTWGSEIYIKVENSKINMLSGNKSFIDISAGKMSNLIFNNNHVTDKINKAVFNIYDASYSVPDGNAAFKGNYFTQTDYPYIVDGVNITSGSFKVTNENNNIQGAEFLNPQYINNKNFLN